MCSSEEKSPSIRQLIDENPRLKASLEEYIEEINPACVEHVSNILSLIIQEGAQD